MRRIVAISVVFALAHGVAVYCVEGPAVRIILVSTLCKNPPPLTPGEQVIVLTYRVLAFPMDRWAPEWGPPLLWLALHSALWGLTLAWVLTIARRLLRARRPCLPARTT